MTGLELDAEEVTAIIEGVVNKRGSGDIIKAGLTVILSAVATIAVLKADTEALKTSVAAVATEVRTHINDHAKGAFAPK